jgi:hypothetical protein
LDYHLHKKNIGAADTSWSDWCGETWWRSRPAKSCRHEWQPQAMLSSAAHRLQLTPDRWRLEFEVSGTHEKEENRMTLLIKALAAFVVGTVLVTSAFAQSARETRGASPYEAIDNEPAPKLIVDQPLPGPLARGIFQAQYRVENVRILPVFGEGALTASPRIGHLHINVDDLPWLWADASDNNTIDIAGLPPGQHKVKIELVDANHNVFPGQVVILTFTVPGPRRTEHHAR